jgi:catechol 2,3-dioxygenase-like lactoylglutathione lyase family enzyme
MISAPQRRPHHTTANHSEDTMPGTESRTRITDVGRVMVPVADQDKAIDFYVDKLGFEKVADIPFGDGERWVEVKAPDATTSIAIVPGRDPFPAGAMTGVILMSADIDATHAELKGSGVDVDAEIMGGAEAQVPRMFFFRDQDNNTLLIVAS